ncbi:MAG: HD domain-containing protein [Planctomycetaceae bacterium]|nr:HD domain-containing protein [Planctomycetaceae bacterium]
MSTEILVAAPPQVETDPRLMPRLVSGEEVRLSEIIAAMSVALDITQGQPAGHCVRNCMIGMRLAQELRLPAEERAALFYALLLKDLGCSSNAAKMAYLFGADEHAVKRDGKLIDWTKAAHKLKYAWQQCAPGGTSLDKLLRMAALFRSGPRGERQLVQVRCERGAEIARDLRFPPATSAAIRALDEHWNGRGHPAGLRGTEIPLLARILCLSQTVEVFFSNHGLAAALDVARDRSGTWFDPDLVAALLAIRGDEPFWGSLKRADLLTAVQTWEPGDRVEMADEACLDRVANAFARVVDAKSPWTYQHSTRVAEIAVGMAQQFDCGPELQCDIRRAGLLHDLGKLGVSSLILDKPGKPTEDEFAQIRKHPDYSQRIIEQVHAFRQLADVASAHHERLDGRGYHRRLDDQQMQWVSRVLAVADVCEALSAHRPYRQGLPWGKIREMMRRDLGTAFDPECFAALERWIDRGEFVPRIEAQLQEMDRLLSELQ